MTEDQKATAETRLGIGDIVSVDGIRAVVRKVRGRRIDCDWLGENGGGIIADANELVLVRRRKMDREQRLAEGWTEGREGDPVTNFRYETTQTALGVQCIFRGPRLDQYVSTVHPIQPLDERAAKLIDPESAKCEAEHILQMLESAFQAGRESMAADMKRLLNEGRER